MLNEAQRRNLRIVMGMIEEKMKGIEAQLASSGDAGLMFEARNDVTTDVACRLREKIPAVYELIRTIRDAFELPKETKMASREILKGLPELWVVLQESESERLRRYGEIDPRDKPLLDPYIEQLERLMLELEAIAMGIRRSESPR